MYIDVKGLQEQIPSFRFGAVFRLISAGFMHARAGDGRSINLHVSLGKPLFSPADLFG